ncbi:MAG TPA: phosphatase PAP2 family protein, partial [Bacillota bacterium]
MTASAAAVPPLLGAGYPLIRWLQQFSHPALDAFFIAVTRLGTEEFYWLFLPALYWLADRRLAARVIALFLVSVFINDALKAAFDLPRPSPDVVRVVYHQSAPGGGFPSGHAQFGVVLWGALAWEWRRPWFTWLAAVLIVLLCLSRLYLGLHFPLDVLGGLLVGALTLAAYIALCRRWRACGLQPTPALMAAALLGVTVIAVWVAHTTPMTMAAKTLGLLLGVAVGWAMALRSGLGRVFATDWMWAPAKLLIGSGALFLVQ